MRTTRVLLLVALAAALALTACSDGGDAADDDVATLGDGDAATSDDEDSSGGGQGGRQVDPEFQDAMVEFAECMREHGIDFPDPQVTGDGGVIIAGPAGQAGSEAGPPSDADREEMEAANEACRPILEEVEGAMPELDPEQEAEMQEQALEFAECMREHGIEMPDPVFGEGGRVQVEVGDDGGPGFDPTDEDFQVAAEECGAEGGFIGAAPAGGSDG